MSTKPLALTIAGSDSGGGAGIQADIKAMEANGVFAASVITAVTAQNTRAVTAAFDLPLAIIEAQLDAVADDFAFGAVKTGMLSSAGIIGLVARKVREHGFAPLVVDPVMISKSGFALLQPDAVEALKRDLFPLATLVTPNVHEAERLAGVEIRTRSDAEAAARAIHVLGPQAVLVKGGHLDGEADAVDVLFDGAEVSRLPFGTDRHAAHARHRVHVRLGHRGPPRPWRCPRRCRAGGESLRHRSHPPRPRHRRWPRTDEPLLFSGRCAAHHGGLSGPVKKHGDPVPLLP